MHEEVQSLICQYDLVARAERDAEQWLVRAAAYQVMTDCDAPDMVREVPQPDDHEKENEES